MIILVKTAYGELNIDAWRIKIMELMPVGIVSTMTNEEWKMMPEEAFGEDKGISYSIYNNMNAAPRRAFNKYRYMYIVGRFIIAMGLLAVLISNLWF